MKWHELTRVACRNDLSLQKSLGAIPQRPEILKLMDGITAGMGMSHPLIESTRALKDHLRCQLPFNDQLNSYKYLSVYDRQLPYTVLNSLISMANSRDEFIGKLYKAVSPFHGHHVFTKVYGIQHALERLSLQITKIASQQLDWNIVEEYEEITQEAIELSSAVIERDEQNIKRRIEVLLDLIKSLLTKAPESIVITTLNLFLMFASTHQYVDFLKNKPILATSEEVKQMRDQQEVIIQYMQEIKQKLGKAEKIRVTRVPCKVKLKPKTKSLTVAELSDCFEVEVLQVYHKWVFVSYYNDEDYLPQTGWILKKYLD